MLSDNKKKSFAPALVLSALALFFCAAVLLNAPVTAQKIKELPPPPPVPRYKPKPTPTPEANGTIVLCRRASGITCAR